MAKPNPTGIEWFFSPRSVAIVGASTKPGKVGHECLKSLIDSGFSGAIYPVNPRADKVLDLKAYPSVLDIPDAVDLAVLAIPAKIAPEVMRQCAEKGVKAVVIISGGFKEAGPEGEALQEEVVRIAREAGIRIIGPNCIGVFDGHTRVDTTFQSHERMGRPKAGSIAFMSQSGTFGATFLDWAAREGIGVSRFASLGNRADVDEADMIAFLSEDPETSVIAIYMESFTDARALLESIRRCPKPVLIFKAGRTEAGAKAAASHTGRLAGRYEIAKSALSQAGALILDSFGELYGAAKALASQPPFKAGGVAMVTNGAGPCVMAADYLYEEGIELAKFSPDTRERLTSELPGYALVADPVVDLTGSATTSDYMTALSLLADDPNVGLLGVFVVFQDTPLEDEFTSELPKLDAKWKPVLVFAAGGDYTDRKRRELDSAGVPTYDDVREFTAAVRALRWGAQRRK